MTRSRASAKSGAPRATFGVDQAPSTNAARAASAAKPVTAVDALLAIQEVPDATSGRSRALKRGSDMLDILDDLRLAVLAGLVPRAKLQALLDVVDRSRGDVADAGLNEVLDEIELRARVELAKFGQAA